MSDKDSSLPERTHYLEALLQYSLSNRAVSLAAGEENIQRLNKIAMQVLGADQFFILLTYPNLDRVYAGLNTEVPANLLQLCNEALQPGSQNERLTFLGEEHLLVEDAPQQTITEAQSIHAKSYMRLPIIINDQPQGAVVFVSSKPDLFDGASLHFGRFLADLVATIVENKLLRDHYRKVEDYQQVAYKMSLLINNDLSLEDVLGEIVNEALRLAKADAALILLLREDSNHLSIAAQAGDESIVQAEEQIALGKGVVNQVFQNPNGNYDYKDALQDILEKGVVGSVLGVPLLCQDKLVGVLTVARKASQDKPELSVNDREILELLSPLAATAIEKTQLQDTVRHERAQLQALLNHVDAPIVVVSKSGKLIMANPEAHQVGIRLNVSLYTMIGEPVTNLLSSLPSDIQLPKDYTVGVPLTVNLGEVGEFVMRIAEVPGIAGEPENYVVIGQEVTKERRFARAKSELLYIISHDIGNILTLGLGYAGIAIEDKLSLEEYEFTIKKIYESLIRARSLILDVVALEATYEESGDARIVRPYDLHEIVRDVYRTYRGFSLDKKQQLTFEVVNKPPQMQGNQALIRQAIENLVTNAIKYTPEGGTIRILLDINEAEKKAVVTIQDTGYGIPEKALPHIWDRYYRVEEHKKLQPGTGIGLPLVKSVIEDHFGVIVVESEVGKGSTFYVRLPLELNSPKPKKPTSPNDNL